MKYIAFTFPGGTDNQIQPINGMPTGGIETVSGLVTWGITMLFIIASILCFIFILWGGISWVTSGGDKAGLEAARKRITFAMIGLVVTFLAFFIVQIVQTFFGFKLLHL